MAVLARFIETALDSCNTMDDLTRTLGDIARMIGCDFFMCVSIIRSPGSKDGITITLKGFPDAWWQRYQDQGYIHHDMVAQQLLNTNRAFLWSELRPDPANPIQQQIMDEASEYGLKHGLSTPFHTQSASAGLTFASRKAHPGLADLKPLTHYLLTILIDNILRIQHQGMDLLSPRQHQVMLLCAGGMTRREIAAALTIKESTVKTHCDAIYSKLNVNSKAEALNKARAMGWLPVI